MQSRCRALGRREVGGDQLGVEHGLIPVGHGDYHDLRQPPLPENGPGYGGEAVVVGVLHVAVADGPRLMALLHELVRQKGNRGAAEALGLDPRTVASCVKAGRLSQRERNDALERRLARLETGKAAQDGIGRASSGGPEPEPTQRRYVRPRTYPQLVTPEAEPDEDLVYGDATSVIVEWRRVRAEFLKTLKTGTTLDRTEVQEPMLELEIAIVGEHELTLPPASFPWDEFDRRDQLWERTQDLKRVRAERERALLRRWLRRIFTFGLWRN